MLFEQSNRSIPPRRFAAACGFTLFLAAALSGCQSVPVRDSVLPRLAGNAPEQQLDYWHSVATKSLLSNDEAFHGLLLYVDGKDDATTYDQRVAALKSRHLLPGNFHEPSDAALDRGTLAVSLVNLLGIKGGLTMRLTGVTPRYAERELEYRELFPPSSPNQLFTGAEFAGVIGKVEDFRHGDPSNVPAAETPPDVRGGTDQELTDATDAVPDEVTPILAMIAPDPAGLALRPATAPATTQSGPIRAVIAAVTGLASVRDNENSPWRPAKQGMELTQDAEFRTGPRGSIQFKIPPDQTVSVDRLTSMKLLTVIRQGGKVTTDVGIKYGRTRYDLEAGGLEHQSTLRSPNATLAVRGTKVSLFDQPPFAPQAISLTGRAEFQARRRRAVMFGNRGQGRTVVTPESETAGDVALRQTVVDPTLPGARTDSEEALLTSVISRGATVTLDRTTGIKIVRGGVPPTNAELAGAFPGRLNFVLRWNGDANLDLGVSTPATAKNPGGEFVYPAAGLNIAPSGGKTAFDHRGGAHGGIEIVYFDKFPDGLFALGGANLSAVPATATLEAFLDGKPLDLFDGLSTSKTVTQSTGPGLPALALVGVNTPLPVVPLSKVQRRTAVKPTAAAPLRPAFVGPLPLKR